MSATNATTYYELSQFVDNDKPTFLGNYNSDMLKIDTAIHEAAEDASTAVSTANTANSTANTASTAASNALTTANAASTTANEASTTAQTALTNAGAAVTAAEAAETAAKANDITNLAPAYDATLTYGVGDLVTYIDSNGTGKLYKCIVAVTSPMAFNINYWDDVTTSEIYSKKSEVLSEYQSDGTKTNAEIYNTLMTGVTVNSGEEYLIKHIFPAGTTALYHQHATYPSNNRIDFYDVASDGTTGILVNNIIISPTTSKVYSTSITSVGTSITDQSDTTPSSRTVQLVKLTTI